MMNRFFSVLERPFSQLNCAMSDYVFLDPGRVFSFYVPDAIHVPCGIADQKVFPSGSKRHVDHLRTGGMPRCFDEHDARTEWQVLLVVHDVIAAGLFRCELDFRHLWIRQ